MAQEVLRSDLYFPIVKDYELEIDGTTVNVYLPKSTADEEFSSDEVRLRQTMHTHTYAEIFFSERNSIEILTEGGIIKLSESDVAFIPPGCRHTLHYRDCSMHRATCGIRMTQTSKGGGKVYKIYKALAQDTAPTVFRGVRGLVDELIGIIKCGKPQSSAAPVLMVVLILDKLASLRSERIAQGTEKPRKDNDEDTDLNRSVVLDEIISSCYHQPIKAEDVAARLYLSRRQFDRVVMRRYGKSFSSVINERRLELSIKYLMTTDLSVDEIVQKIGAVSKPSFCRMFKEKHGVTPNEYRNKNKGK